jgi:hypothetical protein
MYDLCMLVDRQRDERVSRITGILNTHHAALVDETVDLMVNESEWVGPGVWTIESYLHWRAGVSLSTARQLSSIARRVDDLPACITAFRRGELTLDQMAAIARRAPGWIDADIRDLGVSLTVNQLNRVLRDYPFATFDSDGNEITSEPVAETSAPESSVDAATTGPEPSPTLDEYCSYTFGDDGVFRLHLASDFETGRTISSALAEAHDRLFQAGQQSVTMVDAMREVADSSLDTVDDTARASRFKTSVFLDTDATATDITGWTVPDAIRQHLTCDGLLSPVFVDNGVPVSVGRTQRIVPDRTRTLIERRDHGCCTVPGCTRTVGLDVHHIVHWEDGGDTDTWNLVLICSHHHRQHHRQLLGITGNANLAAGADGALEFTDQTGRRILPSGATPIAPMGPTPPSQAPYHHPIGERLRTEHIHFTPRATPSIRTTQTDAA